MTDLAHNPTYLLIEDRLTAIGRKIRLQRLLRGAMRWTMWAIPTLLAATFAAHCLGDGAMTAAIGLICGFWLLASAFAWVIGPLFVRPNAVEVARVIETRVDGLHNGLTNSILLARAADLNSSPFLLPIFEEVLRGVRAKPLDDAVKLADLKRPARPLAAIVIAAAILFTVFYAQFAHGLRQLISPHTFIPQVGSIEITDVQPGNVTLVAGQPLEIVALARDSQKSQNHPALPDARLVFDGPLPLAALSASPADEGQFRYAYRQDHVDQSTRYRLEIGATQSAWFNVNVVRQVKLTGMDFTITPPPYTRQPPTTLTLTADQIDRQPIIVSQGSVVEIGAAVNVPASEAILQVDPAWQIEMQPAADHHRFSQAITVLADTTMSISLLEGSQVVAKFPANDLVIHCKADAAPQIEMKWPSQGGVTIAPTQDLTIESALSDDWGLTSARIWLGAGDGPATVVAQEPALTATTLTLKTPIHLTPEQCADGQSVQVQVEAVDNRDLRQQMKVAGMTGDDGGPQTTRGPLVEIKFVDSSRLSEATRQEADKLRMRLMEMLKTQQELLDQSVAFRGDPNAMTTIGAGQAALRDRMIDTIEKFQFDQQTTIVKRTLQVLAVNLAREAIDLSAAIVTEPLKSSQKKINLKLRAAQQHIVTTLESLLAMLNSSDELAATRPSPASDPLASRDNALAKLDEDLKQYIKQQQKVMNQTASLAKKSVDDFTPADQRLMEELPMAQENLDAFMQQAVSDFSKNVPQDMSDSKMLSDLLALQSEVTMAKGALAAKATETAVAVEDNAVSQAQQVQSDLEKWLPNSPDRTQVQMEDQLTNKDMPLGPLPREMEDMVGKLMEQQEDLFQKMEDANSNLQMSAQQQGWDAADGPISDYSAKGVTGNVLPNNNELQGRSGEGRSGQSQGQFVGDSAVGNGGRDTPTRLDPTPFEKGQVHDTSKDPTGGATGGGKLSGQGGLGLEGPLPAPMQQEMQRLAQRQAELRNTAEKLNLKYRLGRYDNFKLLQAIGQMRRVESDMAANRYQNALLRRDVLIDSLATSKMLLGGRLHVELDTSPTPTGKTQQEISDAMKGELPPAWADALKEYYRKLAEQ